MDKIGSGDQLRAAIVALEERGWQALSTSGEAGRAFFLDVLREDAVMLFPAGIRLTGRSNILASLAAQPWRSFRMHDVQVLAVGPDVAAVLYRVAAQREGRDLYEALVSSTYVREGDAWKLLLHQQTPV